MTTATTNLDGLKVHTAHAEVSMSNDTYHGPVWTDGNDMLVLYRNELIKVKWVAEVGCWLAA